MVDGRGFSPVAVGPLPAMLRQITEVHCQIQMMTLEAALSGNRKMALESLMLDPLCAHLSPAEIRKMGGELISATADFLPQFR
jgi:alpha-galactosidase